MELLSRGFPGASCLQVDTTEYCHLTFFKNTRLLQVPARQCVFSLGLNPYSGLWTGRTTPFLIRRRTKGRRNSRDAADD